MAQIPTTSDTSAKGTFGVDLSLSFNCSNATSDGFEAPVVVMKLTTEIERQARNQTQLDLYKLYRTKIPLECLIELRDVLNTTNDQLQQIDLTKYEIQYLVSILKRYLRELPDPVIPVKFYEQFINIFKQNAEKSVVVFQLMHLINHELPEHHRSTLKWIMAHLCRICCLQFSRGSHDQPLALVQVFCHIFLRPIWKDIIQIVYNTPEHIRIMELLLLNGDWKVTLPEFISVPALPPRKPSRVAPMAIVSPQPHVAHNTPTVPLLLKPHQQQKDQVQESHYNVAMNSPTLANITNIGATKPLPVQNLAKQASQKPMVQTQPTPTISGGGKKESLNLADAEWYWGNISRDEVKEKLMDARDGTFLVRDAISGCGEYTLTLKKDGTDRVIKIFHNNGRYGFLKDCTFTSVVELINFHRMYSLKDYNQLLDIKLLYPVSKNVYDDEYQNLMENKDALVQKFVEVSSEIKTLTGSLEQFHENYKRTENDIGFKRQAHEAFQEAETMFKEQIDIQNRYKVEAQPHEMKKLDENSDLLQQRLKALTECKKNLESDLDQQRRQYQKLELDINKLKLEINALLRLEKKLKQMMQTQNISDTLIKQIMDEGTSAWTNQDTVEHMYEEQSWYCPSFSRSDAEKNLAGAPVGTFLIRLSAANRAYALSIVANQTVNHCIIYKTEHGTFGFAEPYNIYKSLKDLVLHYSINSLEEHNESLQTTLKIPYYAYAQSSSSSTMSNI